MNRLILAALLLSTGACKDKAPEEPSMPKQSAPVWSVYKGEREVMRIKGERGSLTSQALPPGPEPPYQHPFLTGTSLDITEEDSLQTLLKKSASFDDFVARLKKAGYTVKRSETAL